MNKNYIIAVLIAIVLWGGFMVFHHQKQSQDDKKYNEKAYSKITELAKKSPRIGLTHMGMALKRYYEANNKYPEKLDELFPKYLPSKSFIEEINWHYEPKGNNFLVSKRITIGNSIRVASIDKSLRSQTGASIMIAAVEKPKPATLAPSQLTEFKNYRDFLERIKRREMGTSLIRKPEFFAEIDPRIISVVEAEIDSIVSAETSRKYLVWKNENGIIGIGNVQPPDRDRLSIYSHGRWFDIRSAWSKKQLTTPFATLGTRIKKSLDVLAANHSSNALVWRDKNGIMGFGNVKYPDADKFSIYTQGGWLDVESHLPQKQKIFAPIKQSAKKKKNTDDIVSTHSDKYMVWKSKDGTIGFSDIRYPETDNLSYIFINGSWEKTAN